MLSPFASLRVNSAQGLSASSIVILRCAQDDTPESASFDAQLVLFEMLLGLAPTLQWCRAISATPASYQNPNHGLAGSVPIWKPRGTLISHIEEETWEAGITLTVSYMGSPVPGPLAPCNTLTGI